MRKLTAIALATVLAVSATAPAHAWKEGARKGFMKFSCALAFNRPKACK